MRNAEGFSLLEVVLSAAVLSLLSGFILQMFIKSVYVNQKAYNLDMGGNTAAEALESLKAEEFADGAGASETYFDSKWRQIASARKEPGGFSEDVNLILPDNVSFILSAESSAERLNEADVYLSVDSGGGYVIGAERYGIYKLEAAVYELKDNGGRNELVRFSTYKYRQSG